MKTSKSGTVEISFLVSRCHPTWCGSNAP